MKSSLFLMLSILVQFIPQKVSVLPIGSIGVQGSKEYGQCNVPDGLNADFAAIEAGCDHSIGLKNDGSIAVWELHSDASEPNENFTAVSSGGFHSVAFKDDGAIITWEKNDLGQCDVNGDGTDDIFAGADEALGYGVMCLSGISGDTIWTNDSFPGSYTTGCLRTIGDIDLDGVADLAVGTGIQYAVTTFSGATGDVLWSSNQDNAVHFVQRAIGPDPGDVSVLATKVYSWDYCTFFALDGQTGNPLWSTSAISTLDSWIRVTEGDASGNGWSEMGYSIDRASAMNGYVTVRDGHTGVVLQSSVGMYFPSMDICDSSIPCLAVSNWGRLPGNVGEFIDNR